MSRKRTKKIVKLGVIYNAFDPTDITRHELDWRRGIRLSDYLVDLPTDCEWKVALNGKPTELEEANKFKVQPDDIITLVVVPRGGGAKDILRMVAQIAVIAGATIVGGLIGGVPGAIAAAAIAVGGMFLVNALMPMKTPKMGDDESSSYGYDGAKNTVREGVALPVVYGEYRVAGNYIDVFTTNSGDDQYLSGRVALSDGEIDSVRDILINDQPVNNYNNVTTGFTLGTPTETTNFRFGKNTTQLNKQIKLTSSFITHTTTNPVDQIQLNLQFPNGLCHITKKGKKQNRTATIEIQYKRTSDGVWSSFNQTRWVDVSPSASTGNTTKLKIVTQPTISNNKLAEEYNYTVEYKKTTDSTWTTLSVERGTTSAVQVNVTGILGWATANNPVMEYTPAANQKTFEVPVSSGQYQVRIVSGGTVVGLAYQQTSASSSTVSFTDKRTKTIRKTVETGVLPFDTYDIRIRKTSADGADEYDVDELWLTDVGEITNTPVPHRGVATGWYYIKMSEQLSSVPNVTFLVKGVKVKKYDGLGNVLVKEWSDNPAWIVLDMLIGDERGDTSMYSIDFPAFVEWAEWCETNGFKFNGVFDSTRTLWDACQDVLGVGHATFTRVGTKLSVAVDKPSTPQMLFGPGNIFKDSFKITWLPLSDRANEFEVSYYDKDDGNKQKTFRITDPDAENQSKPVRPANINLMGIDNFTQAQKEAWYILYNNRYLRRTITFDAPIESIGCSIGDVVYVQHDMMNWGTSGRTAAGSTTLSVKLDKPAWVDSGLINSILVVHDRIDRATGTFSNFAGGIVTLTGVTGSFTASNVKRIVQDGVGDREILAVAQAGTTAYITIEGTNPFNSSGPIKLIDTDVIEERTITNATGEFDTINVDSAFTIAPKPYSNYMVGINNIVKKPYRLRAINGSGFDRRTLTMVEYNEAIYNPPGYIVPQPPTTLPKYPTHVAELTFTYDFRVTDVNTRVTGTLSWKSSQVFKYAGADIYIAVNESDWVFYKTVLNVSETTIELGIGDDVRFRVVAFNETMIRANLADAPTLFQNIVAGPPLIDAPEDIVCTQISWLGTGTQEIVWVAPVDQYDDVRYRVQVQLEGESTWDDYGTTTEHILTVNNLPEGEHIVRVRAEYSNAYSVWVTEPFLTVDTGDGVLNYTWTAYANSADGTVDFSNNDPAGRAYFGIAVNKSTPTESTNPADYTWSLLKGANGSSGKLLRIVSDRQIITYNGSGVLEPASQGTTFNATLSNVNSPVVWKLTDGAGAEKDAPSFLSGGTTINNRLLQTQAFDQAIWTKNAGATVTANTDASPSGGTTADTITDSNAAASSYVEQTNVIPNDTQAYTFYAFVKKTTADTTSFGINIRCTGGTTVGMTVRVNTNTGEGVKSTDSDPLSTFEVEDAGNWWRVVTHISNNNSGNTTFRAQIFPALGLNSNLSANDVTATGSKVVWGAQLTATAIAYPYMDKAAVDYSCLVSNTVTLSAPNFTTARGSTKSVRLTAVAFDGGDLRDIKELSSAQDGAQGVQGVPGNSSYNWVAYADNITGTVNFTTSSPPEGRAFIGVATNKSTPVESTNPADYTWSPYTGPAGFGLVNGANCTIAGNKLIKTGGTNSTWDSSVYSSEGWRGGAYVSFRALNTSTIAFVGLGSDPITSVDYNTIDYAWYLNSSGNCFSRIEGAAEIAHGSYTSSTIFSVSYDNIYVRWYKDGVLVREELAASSGLMLYLDTSFYATNSTVYITGFGPAGSVGATGTMIINTANCSVTPTSVTKIGGVNGQYDAGARSRDGYYAGAKASVKFAMTGNFVFGLNTDPSNSSNYNDIDYAINNNGTQLRVYRNGSLVYSGSTGDIVIGDVLSVESDNRTVRYYKNATMFYSHAVNAENEVLYFDISIADSNTTVDGISFTGTGSIGVDAINNINRVRNSQFERDEAGFGISVSGLTATVAPFSIEGGIKQFQASYTATAAGQRLNMYIDPPYAIPVAAGERLAVQCKIRANGPIDRTELQIWYRDASNANIGQTTLQTLNGQQAYNTQMRGFATVPAGAVAAFIHVSFFTNAAGTGTNAIAQPMISSALTGQVAYPPFTPGPVDGPTGPAGSNGAPGAPGRDAVVFYQDATPTSPVVGDTWCTLSSPRIWRRWNGTSWVQLLGNIAAYDQVSASQIAVSELSAISAIIGTLRTAASGARMEISDNVIKVFDASNILRVRIGNLSL